jgi:hypothetical protein
MGIAERMCVSKWTRWNMNRRILFLATMLLLTGLSVSADAAVLCANPGGSVFLRPQCRANEQQVNLPTPGLGLQVIFRDVQQVAVLGPGEILTVAASCAVGEVVVSGGYITDSSDILRITVNAPFFDGQNSGWRSDFLNAGETATTVEVRVNVSCIKGTGIGI